MGLIKSFKFYLRLMKNETLLFCVNVIFTQFTKIMYAFFYVLNVPKARFKIKSYFSVNSIPHISKVLASRTWHS